jgi:hypothetical protein
MMYNKAGMHPRLFSIRVVAVTLLYCTTCPVITKFQVQGELGGQDHIRNGGYAQSRQQDANQNLGLAIVSWSVFFHLYPRRYGVRSFYGRYCCEAYPAARGGRIVLLFFLLDINIARLVSNTITGMGSTRSAVVQSVVLPMMLFAWKRIYYVIACVFLLDDSPFKNNGNVPYLLVTKLLGANLSVALGGVSVSQFSQCFSFLAIDWLLFFFRIGLLLRIGQKQCPKLFNQLLDSALSSMLQPMPNSSKAMGNAPAMRQNQAYTCLLEGITLSISFLWYLLIAYIINFLIAGDEKMTLIFRAKSILPVLVLTCADMIQDFLSNKATDKFSTWTVLFLNFTSGPYVPMWIAICLGVGSQMHFKIGIAALSITEAGGFMPITSWSVGYAQDWSF